MNKKLYVGNLSYTTSEADLRQAFTAVAPVASVTMIMDRVTGQSKGFGFVEMETAEGAQEAVGRLNNTQIDQRSITVAEARPQRESSFGGGGDRRSSWGDSSRGGRRR